jgi:hypothetical protein
MGRALLNDAQFDPDTLKLLGRAFDEAWQDIGGNYDVATAEDRRTRLTLIILELAGNGARDLEDIKFLALQIMRHKERPVSLNANSPRYPRTPDQNQTV